MLINFITTAACNIDNINYTLLKIRETEYIYSLSKVFSYRLPVYGAVSETNGADFIPYKYFPFKLISNIPSSKELGANTKSEKEYIALKTLINKMNCNDHEWIIKITGRYLIVDDTLINEVKKSSPDTQAFIYNISKNNIITYFFAMRFGLLKKLLEDDVSCLSGNNLEYYFSIRLEELLKTNNIIFLDTLGIFTNINNENNYRYI
jgi:hypothetical protein